MDGGDLSFVIFVGIVTSYFIVKRICWAYAWKKYYEKTNMQNITPPKELE